MTSTEIELHRQQPLAQKVEWVKLMATASLLPEQYRDNPGNLFYAVEFADSLGVDRINAITSIHVIKGKPTASADLIASLVRKAGHKLRISGDDTRAVAQLIRADDPDFTFEAVWDVQKATAARLWGTDTWKKFPAAMLRARAITEVVRMGASDALYGVVYTPEELGAAVNADGEPVERRPTRSKTAPPFMDPPQTGAEPGEGKPPAGEAAAHATDSAPPTSEDATPAPAENPGGSDAASPTPSQASEPLPDEDGAYPAEIVPAEEAEPRVTPGQRAGLMGHFKRLGVEDRTERLYTMGVLAHRTNKLESANHLSVSEAAAMLVQLEHLKDPEALQAAVIAADEANEQKGES